MSGILRLSAAATLAFAIGSAMGLGSDPISMASAEIARETATPAIMSPAVFSRPNMATAALDDAADDVLQTRAIASGRYPAMNPEGPRPGIDRAIVRIAASRAIPQACLISLN